MVLKAHREPMFQNALNRASDDTTPRLGAGFLRQRDSSHLDQAAAVTRTVEEPWNPVPCQSKSGLMFVENPVEPDELALEAKITGYELGRAGIVLQVVQALDDFVGLFSLSGGSWLHDYRQFFF